MNGAAPWWFWPFALAAAVNVAAGLHALVKRLRRPWRPTRCYQCGGKLRQQGHWTLDGSPGYICTSCARPFPYTPSRPPPGATP